MEYAEQYATPVHGSLGESFPRSNDFQDVFFIRWGRIEFDVAFGVAANVKAVLKVYREGNVCESFIVDTDPMDVQWNRHRRRTRDFFILPVSACLGPATCVKFSFIIHLHDRSIPSRLEYIFMDRPQLEQGGPQERRVTAEWATPGNHRTVELDGGQLQRDVDWANGHFESLNLIPKFTRGQQHHPFHPKHYIHQHIDQVIRTRHAEPGRLCTIKVSVDCIDDHDFIAHLVHARDQGVLVQCVVDWRKMTLTNSHNYERLKRSGIDLVGVFCTPRHDLIEVDPDMHTKFIIFNDEDCILGSFNITFDRWWANWESGMTFQSKGVCRLLDNIFQSQRGGVNQAYRVDPASPFNLLYTFGRHHSWDGKPYLPHHAILAGIHRARHSIRICLFLMGELLGEHRDSVVDALIEARNRGVDVEILLNGHLARQGTVGVARSMEEEIGAPLLPAVHRLVYARMSVGLVYGRDDHPVPYSPIHSKYCVVDGSVVMDGSFNWYNTSVFSHDLLVVVDHRDVARLYLSEFEQIQREFRVYYYFPSS